ncbi:metal-sensitive transcriptional regulator [Arcanobacterium haemolyticum]|nr:metal-sensitive transcriptional regulator [Arcanobacterium haemolyticum]
MNSVDGTEEPQLAPSGVKVLPLASGSGAGREEACCSGACCSEAAESSNHTCCGHDHDNTSVDSCDCEGDKGEGARIRAASLEHGPGNVVASQPSTCGCAQARAAGAGLPSEQGAHQHGYVGDKQAYLKRMKRIEGQARGITRMIDEDKYCIDILTQISALTRALQGVAIGLMDDHLKHCVLDAASLGGDDAAIKLKEATDAIARLVRS